jgi:hypothetical protein
MLWPRHRHKDDPRRKEPFAGAELGGRKPRDIVPDARTDDRTGDNERTVEPGMDEALPYYHDEHGRVHILL